ncbi:hypothetical protein [Variovorax sp. V118]|uniref:hypothetical protein n=1 Tax=Variovorax sp. V118 TaxID=3065954 RepID=UPI0034E8A5AF
MRTIGCERFALGRDERALYVCIVVSFAAHVAMLSYSSSESVSTRADYATLAGTPSPSFRARLKHPQPAVLPSTDKRTVEMPRSLTAQPERPKFAALVFPALATDSRPPDFSTHQQEHAESPQEAATRPEELDGYVPRPLLTQAPVPRAPIEIHPPNSERGASAPKYAGVLSLFIDEDGEVRHILADEPPLPYEFEQAVRNAFSVARFIPGMRDGRIVKSRLKVEVVFDAIAPIRSEPTALAP